MKLLSVAFALAALLIILAGAGAGEVTQTSYFPLEVGNQWHYKVGTNKFLIKVARHEKVGKVDTARLEVVVDGKVRASENLAVVKGYLCRLAVDGKEAKPPVPFLEVPLKAGAHGWNVESKVGDQLVKARFQSGDKTTKVGSYKNVVTVSGKDLEVNGAKVGITYYFAENVGPVKWEVLTEGQRISFELEKFERAKSK